MKLQKSKKAVKILSCVLALAMFCSIGAVAVETYDSGNASHGMVGANIYQFRSTLYADSGSKWRAATWVQAEGGKSVPAGYMKAKAMLYDAAGYLCRSTTLQTNAVEANYFFVATPAVKGTGEYISQGIISEYSAGVYTTVSVAEAVRGKTDVIKALETNLGTDGGYPVNAHGQTYGSALLRNAAGNTPDLIAAIGTNNVKGYVRMDELDPFTATPKEAVALAASAKSVVLPLYDLSGKVIGTFVQDVGVSSNSKEFKRLTFNAARTKAAAGSYPVLAQTVTLPKTAAELTVLAEKALTITPYARNSMGQTYGSDSLCGEVGYSPDLIRVTSTDTNLDGYVKRLDMNGGSARFSAKDAAGNRVVPVYDLNGKVIGEFKFETGGSSNDPKYDGMRVEEARKAAANGA
ncbi:MAG: hypothetical protein RR336_07820 [Oscillospiraceae bacterium]